MNQRRLLQLKYNKFFTLRIQCLWLTFPRISYLNIEPLSVWLTRKIIQIFKIIFLVDHNLIPIVDQTLIHCIFRNTWSVSILLLFETGKHGIFSYVILRLFWRRHLSTRNCLIQNLEYFWDNSKQKILIWVS